MSEAASSAVLPCRMKARSRGSSARPKSTRACSAWSCALMLIWCVFDIASGILRGNFGGLLGGSFLTPRNLWTLLVQTSSIAIMSTGMVLLIVMRQHRPVGRLHALASWPLPARCFRSSDLGTAARRWPSGHLDHRRHLRALRSARCDRRFQRLADGLCENPGLHRHAWRPHRLQRRRLPHLPRAKPSRRWTRPSRFSVAAFPISWLGPFWSWILALIACAAIDRVAIVNWPPPAPALQVSAAPDVGRSLPRRHSAAPWCWAPPW